MVDRILALPTTRDVRWWWAKGVDENATEAEANEQFDRWLLDLLARAWDAGALRELNEWAPPHDTLPERISSVNPYRNDGSR